MKPFLEGLRLRRAADATSKCPAGTAPIYRAFKGPPRRVDDGNHRFSTSLAQHQDMVTRLGWADDRRRVLRGGVTLLRIVAHEEAREAWRHWASRRDKVWR